jgi:hypothetical protein
MELRPGDKVRLCIGQRYHIRTHFSWHDLQRGFLLEMRYSATVVAELVKCIGSEGEVLK